MRQLSLESLSGILLMEIRDRLKLQEIAISAFGHGVLCSWSTPSTACSNRVALWPLSTAGILSCWSIMRGDGNWQCVCVFHYEMCYWTSTSSSKRPGRTECDCNCFKESYRSYRIGHVHNAFQDVSSFSLTFICWTQLQGTWTYDQQLHRGWQLDRNSSGRNRGTSSQRWNFGASHPRWSLEPPPKSLEKCTSKIGNMRENRYEKWWKIVASATHQHRLHFGQGKLLPQRELGISHQAQWTRSVLEGLRTSTDAMGQKV